MSSVGGVVVHDRLDVADDGGGLLQEKHRVGGDGLEIVLAGEAVGGEVGDDGFDVADDAGGTAFTAFAGSPPHIPMGAIRAKTHHGRERSDTRSGHG